MVAIVFSSKCRRGHTVSADLNFGIFAELNCWTAQHVDLQHAALGRDRAQF